MPYLEHGWQMPRGIAVAGARDPTNFTLAEWQQAKRQGIDPRWLKSTLQACWSASDNRRAFESALQEHGFFLAKGDKRSFVVLDHEGEVYSLPRMLGAKTKEIRDRLGDGEDLPGVDATKKRIGERMTPAIRRHVAESRAQFQDRTARLDQQRAEMTELHRKARIQLKHQQNHQWQQESRERTARLPTGLRGLWHRLTGHYQDVRRQNEQEAALTLARHADERQALIDRQQDQRSALQSQYKQLRQTQAEQLLELRREVGRYLHFTRNRDEYRTLARERGVGLRLER